MARRALDLRCSYNLPRTGARCGVVAPLLAWLALPAPAVSELLWELLILAVAAWLLWTALVDVIVVALDAWLGGPGGER